MSALFLIETPASISLLRRALKKEPGACCVSSDEFVVMALRRFGVECLWLGEHFSPNELASADRRGFEWAAEWHARTADRELFEYRGIDLAFLVELAFGSYLARLFREEARVRNFLAHEKIDRVCLIHRHADRLGSFYASRGESLAAKAFSFHGILVEERRIHVRKSGAFAGLMDAVKKIARAATVIFLKPPAKDGREAVLFCSATQHIENLVREMKDRRRLFYLDEERQFSKRAFVRENGIHYLSCDAFDCMVRSSDESRVFLGRFKKLWPVFLESVAKGETFFPLIEDRLSYFAARVPTLVRRIDVFYDLLQRYDVKVVVADEDVIEFRRTLVSVAARLGKKSLVVLHATTPSFSHGVDLAPLTATALSVGGNALKSDSECYGIPGDRIVVTGVPRYDKLHILDANECRTGLCRRYGLSSDRPIVFLAGTYISDRLDSRGDWWDLERAYHDLFTALAKHPDKQVLIRPYRMDENRRWIEWIAKQCGVRGVICSDMRSDFEREMAGADLVVTFQSSAVTEAFALKKKVIVLDYLKRIGRLNTLSEKPCSTFLAQNRSEIESLLKRLFSRDEDTARDLETAGAHITSEWAGGCDGGASKRVAELVEKLACGASLR